MSGLTPRCFHILRNPAACGSSRPFLACRTLGPFGEVPLRFAVEGQTLGFTQEGIREVGIDLCSNIYAASCQLGD